MELHKTVRELETGQSGASGLEMKLWPAALVEIYRIKNGDGQ